MENDDKLDSEEAIEDVEDLESNIELENPDGDIDAMLADRKLGGDPNDPDARDADFSLFDRVNQQAELEKELKDVKEKYLRTLADLDNIKKRSMKERSDMLRYEGESLLRDLLPVIDNFDRAMENSESTAEQLREGLGLISKMLGQTLEKWNVRSESAVGKPFDPQVHEAISQIPSADHEAGIVMNELEKIYYFKDKMLRPARVVVATAPVVDTGQS
jgi:molecular chaperone GrpE